MFHHFRVIGVIKVEFGKILRAQCDEVMAIRGMQDAFTADFMCFGLARGEADRDLATQGIAVVEPAHRRFDVDGAFGMTGIKPECRDEPFVDIQARDLGNLVRGAAICHIERAGKGRGCHGRKAEHPRDKTTTEKISNGFHGDRV
ncbi:hypothetical protein KMAL_01400 [Novacetimonas maltaceti]|uniref:Uncharacterized protein n=1 Tax=Novacetimonas maltaceti TaxID=1203393 RepID=A0A2S3W5T9_9PROT|nr:hypothetical protein KMAL_01400 [Novacetimonas maltaceti]